MMARTPVTATQTVIVVMCILLLTTVLGCDLTVGRRVTILYTTDTWGAIEPCG